ncbi:MAG: hypothetical protein WCD44_00045 [Candidatus Babeliales bacterium]
MMNTTDLFKKFSQGLNWNALLYSTYKILFTLLSFLLLKKLTTIDFSYWANINSITFLLLLWLDFGFRKSVPRYTPEFINDMQANKKFIRTIILFQLIILFSSIPLFQFLLKIVIKNPSNSHIIILASFLFLAEGIAALLRLVYHSYFLHKQYNILAISIMIVEMAINMLLIYFIHQSSLLLTAIFINKIITGAIIIISSSIMLIGIIPYPKIINKINSRKKTREFIKHSAIMWTSNNLKSLSERNFVIPFITYTFGPAIANSFKVANDISLLFYRIVIKTIGTTDTLLLTYVAMLKEKKLLRVAFTKLTTKITRLCLPFLGIIFFLAIKSNIAVDNPFVFHSFLIMVIGYLLETMLLPYERILEVNSNYRELLLSYIPYTIMLICIFSGISMPFLGLLGSILLMHVVRLVSLIIIVYFVYKNHPMYVSKSPYVISFLFNIFKFKISSLYNYNSIKSDAVKFDKFN